MTWPRPWGHETASFKAIAEQNHTKHVHDITEQLGENIHLGEWGSKHENGFFGWVGPPG